MRILVTVLFTILSISSLSAQDEYGTYLGNVYDFIEAFKDPYAGLTTLPILEIPLGGVYEARGSAYTAIATEASFSDANPAGTSILEFTEFSVYHNDWIADTNIEGAAYTYRDKNLGMGFSGKFLYMPFTEYDEIANPVSSANFSETMITANVSYNLFNSYYFNGVSLGINGKLVYRNVPDSIETGQSLLGIVFDVGALTRVNFLKFYSSREKNFSFGLALKNAGPSPLTIGSSGVNEPLPANVTAGIAYKPIRPLTVSVDVGYPLYFGLELDEAVMPFGAIGIGLQFTNFLELNTGFLYKSGPRFTLGSDIDLDFITLTTNYTLDLTTQLKGLDRFSIQARFNFGDEGRQETQDKVDNLYLEALEAYVAGDLDRAIKLCEEALELDPGFNPAKETLETAKETRELQNRIEELQSID